MYGSAVTRHTSSQKNYTDILILDVAQYFSNIILTSCRYFALLIMLLKYKVSIPTERFSSVKRNLNKRVYNFIKEGPNNGNI